MREPWVGFEGDHLRVDYGFEFFRRHGTKLYRDHGVHLTVALQDRDVLVAARRLQSRDKTDLDRGPPSTFKTMFFLPKNLVFSHKQSLEWMNRGKLIFWKTMA